MYNVVLDEHHYWFQTEDEAYIGLALLLLENSDSGLTGLPSNKDIIRQMKEWQPQFVKYNFDFLRYFKIDKVAAAKKYIDVIGEEDGEDYFKCINKRKQLDTLNCEPFIKSIKKLQSKKLLKAFEKQNNINIVKEIIE